MKRSPLRRHSKNPISKLRKKAIITFNAWIRRRDAKLLKGRCYTCGGAGSEAGHYGYGMLRFDPRGVHLQDTRCNRFLHGNLGPYAARLIQDYGWDTFNELEQLKRTPLHINVKYLQKIIETYDH